MARDCAESGPHVKRIQCATDEETASATCDDTDFPFFFAFWTCKKKTTHQTRCCVLEALQQIRPHLLFLFSYIPWTEDKCPLWSWTSLCFRVWLDWDIDSVFKQTLTLRLRGARPFPPSCSCRATGGDVFPAVCLLRHLWANEPKLQQRRSAAAGCSWSSSCVTQIPSKLNVFFFCFIVAGGTAFISSLSPTATFNSSSFSISTFNQKFS